MKLLTTSFSPMLKALPSVGIDGKVLSMPKAWRKLKKWSPSLKNEIIGKIKEHDPDVFFILKEPYLNKILPLIRKTLPKTKIVMWYGDQRGYTIPTLLKSRRGMLDALLVTNTDGKQIKMYRNKLKLSHIYTFYHSFSTEEFQLWPIAPKFDVFFGGTNFSPTKFPLSRFRRKLITAIHNKFKMVVHGGGWSFPTQKWILRPVYAKALRKAKINLGINHYDIKRYYNRRLFESVGSGRLHVTYYIPGMESHFKNHEHLVWFKSVPEAIKLISHYLKNEKAREKIAKQGREFFIKHHSWTARVKTLKDILGRL
jgi:hypothetical protein